MTERIHEFLEDPRLYQDVPCRTNCPVHTDVEGYIKLVGRGEFEAAHRLIRETNPFPAICGRVCQHFCETDCNRGMMDRSVAIMRLKRVATDYSMKNFKLPEQRHNTLDKLAVVGAGPAGLTAAHDLANMGYRVTVFESMPHPGGMMRYGIPKFRLPREVIDLEVEYIKRLGVEIKYNMKLGVNISLQDMQEEFKAVLIATGAHKAMRLPLPGKDLDGVYYGADFMRFVNSGEGVPPLEGKTVVVIGAGFSGMDISRSCIRLGAKKIITGDRLSRDEIPVSEEEVHDTEEEGVTFRYREEPVEILSRDGKTVSGVRLAKDQLVGEPDANGRRRLEKIPGSELTLDCDYIVISVNQLPDTDCIPDEMGFKLTGRGLLDVDKETFATSVPGIFSCGDFITGTRSIITVIAEGHSSAIAMDAYIRGVAPDFNSKIPLKKEENLRQSKKEMYDDIPRHNPEMIGMKERLSTFQEIEHAFNRKEAEDEAARCLQCSYSWTYDSDSCILCLNCIDVCPQKCLTIKPLTELQFNRLFNEDISLKNQGLMGIEIDRSLCIRCSFCEQVCPTDSISFGCFKKAPAAAI